jgi:uncharacterized protein with NRDE domain
MCVILASFKTHPVYKLVVAANRDEFHDRPASAAEFWSDDPDILAGRDLDAGGTWLGVHRNGHFAAITNYREPASPVHPSAPSRGELVANFLRTDESTAAYVASLRPRAEAYAGFSMIVSDADSLAFLSNRGLGPRFLAPGIYGLSNHLLDTPWPKVARGRQKLAAATGTGESLADELFGILADRSVARENELPRTGFSVEEELAMSPLFIVGAGYGTRSSTVVLVGDREIELYERSFSPEGVLTDSRSYRFAVATDAAMSSVS